MNRGYTVIKTPGIVIALGFVLLLGFQNCSRVQFANSLSEKKNAGGLANAMTQMTINNGAKFTTAVGVKLQLEGTDLEQMYITNDSSCDDGGKWESFAPERAWTLNQTNKQAHVYAKFIAENGKPLACIEASIIHDNLNPKVDITEGPKAFSNNAEAQHSFHGEDSGSGIKGYECKTATATSWVSCQSPFQQTGLGEGNSQFLVRSLDEAGNVSDPVSDSWLIDLTPPVIRLVETPPTLSNSSSTLFRFENEETGSGLETTFCTFDTEKVEGAIKTDCPSPSIFDDLGTPGATKNYRFTAWSKDKAGNISTPVSFAFVVNNVPAGDFRITGITGGKDSVVDNLLGTVPNPTVNWTMSAQATSYLVSIFDETGKVRICPESTTADLKYSYSTSACSLVDGNTYVASVISVNALGNNRVATPLLFRVDLSPPIIQITGPKLANDDKNATFDFTITDLSGVALANCLKTKTGDQGTVTNSCLDKSTITYTNLPLGEHGFQIASRDKAGNEGMSPVMKWQVNEVVCDPFSQTNDQCVKGLKGNLYYLSEEQKKAPFKEVDRYINEGVKANITIYMSKLTIPTTPWTSGFETTQGTIVKNNAGETLFEFFAMRFDTVVKLDPAIDTEGVYQFAILSDDGTTVEIKNTLTGPYQSFIGNDGDHSTRLGCHLTGISLKKDSRVPMRIKYYQGPRVRIALTLLWRKIPAASANAQEEFCDATKGDEFYYGAVSDTTPPDYVNHGYGKLVQRGWKPLAISNFIAAE